MKRNGLWIVLFVIIFLSAPMIICGQLFGFKIELIYCIAFLLGMYFQSSPWESIKVKCWECNKIVRRDEILYGEKRIYLQKQIDTLYKKHTPISCEYCYINLHGKMLEEELRARIKN